MVSLRVGEMQLYKLNKHALEWEQSGGRRAGRWQEVGGEGEGRLYHDISPLLCCYISERHSFSTTLEAARGGQSGGRGGVWGVRVLEGKILYSCWGMDISVGEPHIIRVRPPNKLNQVP